MSSILYMAIATIIYFLNKANFKAKLAEPFAIVFRKLYL